MNRCPLSLFASLVLVACTPVQTPPSEPSAPASAVQAWPHGAMVSAANPAAVDAALAVLAAGGHAVDAAIAAHAVLGLVEPESSGLGGSAFMLVYDRTTDRTVVFDGRETAPAGTTAASFTRDGEPLGFRELWSLGVSVGVPGTVALYDAAHARFGRSTWASLFAPAIRLAEEGFEVTAKFVRYNDALAPALDSGAFPEASAYMMPAGVPTAAGDLKRNPAFANTLRQIAADGAEVFYRGELAAAIVARAQEPPLGSAMTFEDIAAYRSAVREAVCGDFRDSKICSVPPPSSGIAQIMIPALYDLLLDGNEKNLDDRIEVFVDAQRLAYADRDQFVGDPDFVAVPVTNLLDPAYLLKRAGQRFAPSGTPTPGDPSWLTAERKAAWRVGSDATVEAAGTSHLSIIDAEGNAVSMTASVGFPYGSIRMTHGFFLNNQLTDFSLNAPDDPPAANAVAPLKRPRSSMSPTIVFDRNGDPRMLTGSAGGSSILAYTTKTMLAVLDWNLSAQEAVDFPNIVARGESVGVEVSAAGGQGIADALIARGYPVNPGRGENSGLHVIVVRPDGMEGAADSRRHGTVGRLPPR